MKKIPYGISDYKDLILGNYYFIDKTKYLEKLEDDNDTLMYFRPEKFGKSLFTSMMFYYFDINSKNSFESLFKDTYIYNNPTKNKNNYYVLKLDFSKIRESSKNVYDSFNDCVVAGIRFFCEYYDFDYQINEKDDAETILLFFLSRCSRLENKVYIIIDDYDAYMKSLLEESEQSFKSVSSMAKAFYANIKKGVGSGVVGRFFATGNCRLDLTTMTSGFNIAWELTYFPDYHSMIGLTSDEVKNLIKEFVYEKDQEKVYQLILENCGGYLFDEDGNERTFNSTLVMAFLNKYQENQQITTLDNGVNYKKIDNLLKIKNNSYYEDILEKLLKNGKVIGDLKTFYILESHLGSNDLLSLLFNFGYLTIEADKYCFIRFKIPNKVMQETWNSYFLNLLNINIDEAIINEVKKEIIDSGNITKLNKYVEEILKQSEKTTFMKIDEKYIQLIYACLLMKNSYFDIDVNYQESIFIKSKNESMKNNILIKFECLEQDELNDEKVTEKLNDGKNQIKELVKDETLKKYVIVYSANKIIKQEEVK